ncbi:MAG: hypothetical protein H6717_08000 [Polyangiaceae bacterium]|nr:hypothetical protein [Polyangiaceae bacterium]
MRWLRRLWARFVEWFLALRLPGGVSDDGSASAPALPLPPAAPPPPYRVVHLTDDPDELLPETLYAIGENGHLWHVSLVCPCGCGATIALNVLPDDSPRWRLYESADGPTLSPSVWRTTGCWSHFILRRGYVIWCHGRRPDDVSETEYSA